MAPGRSRPRRVPPLRGTGRPARAEREAVAAQRHGGGAQRRGVGRRARGHTRTQAARGGTVSAERRRVAVTGIGLVTPLGVGTAETWEGLLEARSAVAPIGSYDASSLRTQLGAEIDELEAKEFVARRALRTMTRYDVLAMVAAVLAMRDSGVELPEDDADGRAALFTASGKEISKPEHFEEIAVEVRDEHGNVDMRQFGTLAPSGVHPLFFIEGIQGASLFYV